MKKYIISIILSVSFPLSACAQVVEPMLQSYYHQSAPYNNSCPENTVAGCGPIAIAQILRYYGLPAHGYGNVDYLSGKNKHHIKMDLSRVAFDWDNILLDYSGSYSETEAEAVADMVFACGAAVYAQYGTATSLSNHVKTLYGLHHHLHISAECRYLHRKFYSTAEWIEMIDAQLRNGRPILYRGTSMINGKGYGHLFVIDGLNDEGLYHVKFGKNRNRDKFVDINVLNQGGGFPGGKDVCYNVSQAMFCDLVPVTDEQDYPMQQCISEEAVILDRDSMLREKEIGVGEDFSLSCRLRNYCDDKAKITFGWGLCGENGLERMLFTGSYNLSSGYTFVSARHCVMRLPENISDGDYTLSIFSKSDKADEWQKAWMSAPSDVKVSVKDGKAVITVPDNHLGHCNLYLKDEVKMLNDSVFHMVIANETTNNFEGEIKIDVTADGENIEYRFRQSVYSQSVQTFNVLLPKDEYDMDGRHVEKVRVSYYDEIDREFVEMGINEISGIDDAVAETKADGNLSIYRADGYLVREIPAGQVPHVYPRLLKSLPHGIYVVRENDRTRKIYL